MARGEVGSGGDVTTTVTTLSDWPPVLHAIAARTVVKSAIRVEVIVAPRLIRGQLDCKSGWQESQQWIVRRTGRVGRGVRLTASR